jgi:hypothetical protein
MIRLERHLASHTEKNLMISNDEVARLDQRLARQSLGPLDAISSQAASALLSCVRSITTALRQAAHDRPLNTLLLSFEVGYLLARSGRRITRR